MQPYATYWTYCFAVQIQPLVVHVREKEQGDHLYWKPRDSDFSWALEGGKQELGEELMRGRTLQLEVRSPWGGKELGNLWELKEEPRRKESVD